MEFENCKTICLGYLSSQFQTRCLLLVAEDSTYFADEGEYQLVKKIQLEHPFLFNDIFPMLGRIYTALKCAEKNLKGCEAEDAFIE